MEKEIELFIATHRSTGQKEFAFFSKIVDVFADFPKEHRELSDRIKNLGSTPEKEKLLLELKLLKEAIALLAVAIKARESASELWAKSLELSASPKNEDIS